MNPQVADMDNDGDLDLIIGTRAGHTEYFERQDDGTLIGPDTLFDIEAGANSNPLVVDWNNDEYPDLLIAGIHTYHDYPRPVYLFINEGKDTYSVDPQAYDSVEAPLLDSIEKYRTIAWADIDGDGLNDLLVSHNLFDMDQKSSYFKVRWHRNKGTAEKPKFEDYTYLSFEGSEDVGHTKESPFRLPYLTCEDYNGDSVPDILAGVSQQKLGEPAEQVAVWYGKRVGVGIQSTVSFSQKPTVNITNKQIRFTGIKGKWNFSLCNSKGQMLRKGNLTGVATLNFTDLANGVYTLSISQDGLQHSYQVRF